MPPRLKRTSKKKRRQESLEELIGRLELYNGCWAIKLGDSLMVFPQETTREQVELVMKAAHERVTNPSSTSN